MTDPVTGVQVGPIVTFQNPRRAQPWQEVYRQGLDYISLSEELGFDFACLSEHHFVDDGYSPALLPIAAAIAARTTRLRISTQVLLLPFHDPVRVAEDAAAVDIISGGRLELGLAAGYRREEFAGFGIEQHERGARFREGVAVLRHALTGEAFEHEGAFFRYGSVRVSPPPVQQPLPLWLGGRSEAAMRRVARLGANLTLSDNAVDASEADYGAFVTALAAEGRDPAEISVMAITAVHLDEDPERARRVAQPALEYAGELIGGWVRASGDRYFEPEAGEENDSGLVVGTPDDAVTALRRLHARVPFTHLRLWMWFPGIPAEDARRSLELFARTVLPALKDLPRGPHRPTVTP